MFILTTAQQAEWRLSEIWWYALQIKSSCEL